MGTHVSLELARFLVGTQQLPFPAWWGLTSSFSRTEVARLHCEPALMDGDVRHHLVNGYYCTAFSLLGQVARPRFLRRCLDGGTSLFSFYSTRETWPLAPLFSLWNVIENQNHSRNMFLPLFTQPKVNKMCCGCSYHVITSLILSMSPNGGLPGCSLPNSSYKPLFGGTEQAFFLLPTYACFSAHDPLQSVKQFFFKSSHTLQWFQWAVLSLFVIMGPIRCSGFIGGGRYFYVIQISSTCAFWS